MRFKEFELRNKSRLVVVELPGLNSVAVSAYFRAGFRYDPDDKPGLAHFTEHMLFSGTKNYPNSEALEKAISRLGGWHWAFTWIDYQCQMLHLPVVAVDQGVKLLSEIILRSNLAGEEVRKERGVVIGEINRNLSDPEKAIWDYAWPPLFWQGTKLARPYSGRAEDISKITQKDVRSFFSNYFLPANTVFLVAGGIQAEKIYSLFENGFRDFRRSETVRSEEISLCPKRLKSILIYQKTNAQTTIAIGFKAVNTSHSDRHTLELIKYILGGSFASVLPQKLREAGGLIYNWQIWQDALIDTGYLVFITSTDKKNVNNAVRIIFDEFKRLKKKKFSEKELNDWKSGLSGSLLANMETGQDYIRWYAQFYMTNSAVVDLDEQVVIYQKITARQVQEVANKYFRGDNWYLGCVGEVEESEISVPTF